MDPRNELLRPTWVEIDLDALRNNTAEIRRIIGPEVKLIAVLKGNAYGCGLSETIETLSQTDIYGFAVGNIYEAIETRKITNRPILLFGNTLINAIPEIRRHHLIPSIGDLEWARAYSSAAAGGPPGGIFVKVDIGLNRLGVPLAEALPFFEEIRRLPGIRIEGIQTHITGSKDDVENAFKEFIGLISALEKRGFEIPVKLGAQSQLIAQSPFTYLNAVDPGKMIYGIASYKIEVDIRLQPAFVKLASRFIHIKRKTVNFQGGPGPIGVVPLGMADGLPSVYAQNGEALVHGRRVPIIAVHAEHTRINLSAVPGVAIGDEVIFIGSQGEKKIDFYEVSKKCYKTESELLRALSRCLPRVYIRNGSPCKTVPVL